MHCGIWIHILMNSYTHEFMYQIIIAWVDSDSTLWIHTNHTFQESRCQQYKHGPAVPAPSGDHDSPAALGRDSGSGSRSPGSAWTVNPGPSRRRARLAASAPGQLEAGAQAATMPGDWQADSVRLPGFLFKFIIREKNFWSTSSYAHRFLSTLQPDNQA
jgi:hypothetical protein